MAKIYYTKITLEPSSEKYGWKYGGYARTYISNYENGEGKIRFSQFAKSSKDAEEKLLKEISIDGTLEIECVGETFNINDNKN